MLGKKSFNPAKCKTALKLAGSRIKILRNKKEAQVKQMKMELAKLLESSQDRTAMIRVEHVVMEEKKLSAYDLIEIYCELIVARLPVIESQKKCPVDLKEAITSVVFAAPRCADIPELMDARKHFAAKYGKEFISAAVELRPDCGVARMMIEKLSAKAPDGQGKIKILKSIAEEHHIKWDTSADNDPMPPEDLLNGPSTFGKASQMYTDLPNVQVQPSHDDVPPNHNRNSIHCDPRTVESRVPISDPGRDDIKVEFRHSYCGNMEFKDAAAAAHEAAECADRASMAARAAAHLSTRESQYYYSPDSPTHNLERYSGTCSSSNDDHDPAVNRSQMTDERNSGRSGGMSFSKQSTKSEFKSFKTSEDIDQARIRKQVSNSSHVRAVNSDCKGLVDPYTGKQTSSNGKASLVFGSDAVHKYYKEEEPQPILFCSSPRQDPTTASRLDDMVPVTFDDSDGPSSESDVDVESSIKSKLKKSDSDLLNEGKFGQVKGKFCASEEVIRNEEYSLGLNLGMLRGGLRNKYTKNLSPCPPRKVNGKSSSMPSHTHLDNDSDFEQTWETKARSGRNLEISRTSTDDSLKLAARELPSDWSPSKEKHSHVHPKLPDIDTFTAHFHSLRR